MYDCMVWCLLLMMALLCLAKIRSRLIPLGMVTTAFLKSVGGFCIEKQPHGTIAGFFWRELKLR